MTIKIFVIMDRLSLVYIIQLRTRTYVAMLLSSWLTFNSEFQEIFLGGSKS